MNMYALKTMVSEEVADEAHAIAEELGLSINQYVKMLVLQDQGHDFTDLSTDVLKDYLRGK